jgi:hypothetical protein
MATEAQINANRRNAKRSTGPRTSVGKERSSRNALRHGLLARESVLPDEDGEEFDVLAARIRQDLRPQGELEEFLCQRVINTTWRLIRAARIETGLFASALAEERTQLARDEAKRFLTEPIRRELEKRMLKAAKMANTEDYLAAQISADVEEALGKTDLAVWGRAFAQETVGANALLLLARYENTIERSFFRALEALEREQKRRKQMDVNSQPRDE